MIGLLEFLVGTMELVNVGGQLVSSPSLIRLVGYPPWERVVLI